jgi:hypothetical protein
MSINENSTRAVSSLSEHTRCVGDSDRLKVTSRGVIGLALLCACSQRTASAEQPAVSSEPVSKTFAAKAAGSVVNSALDDKSPLGDDEGDADLRRGYGIVDMRFDGCVKRQNDHTVLGDSCPTGFLIYGPYVPVPANSEIDVSFDVRPSKDILIYADIVSQMGKQTLAGLNRQRVAAGQLQKVGYRVHVFNADVNVESRIGMDAEPGTHFELSNLTMTVR